MSTFTIGDLVKRDQQAEFRNDVQLSSYEDEERNRSLVCSYLFTSTAPQGSASSTNVLFNVIEAYLNERLENRFVVIANYGHGKSHLALALANYFGKVYESPEVQTILDKINKAFSNSSSALRYKEFKENRREFLVVRIRGDVAGSLREQFLTSLEKALGEHELPIRHLPGWYAKAENYLLTLQGDNLKKANQYLEQFELDVPMLIQEVKLKRDRAYDLFGNLYAHLDEHGFKPDMEGELSLAQAIRWAVKEFCGEGKPLGGILILFDEFSLYVNNYAQRSAAGDLQDMLNGVSDSQGKVVFLAFAVQDPITTAQNALAGGSSNQRDSLLKELTRIPKSFILHSLMESVIDSYLEQPTDKWQRFAQDSVVSLPLSSATNVAYEQFRDRYEKLGWTSLQRFEEKVTKGCFPLHPITTAMLCSMQFQQSVTASGTPRNILGFILERLDDLQEQPAVIGKRINWILPIYLVDYFGERLPLERYQAYQNAVQKIKSDDENAEFSAEEQTDVLKALLLQEIARLKARDEDQIELIASMVGMPPSDTKKCLRSLSDAKVIAWVKDNRRSYYSLYSHSTDPYKLDQILDRKLENVALTWQDLLKLSQEQLKATTVSIPWGHPQDWQAPEYIMDAENFNANSLRDLVRRFNFDVRNGMQDGDRGCVIWLLARNEDEVAKYKQDAPKVLDDAFPEPDPLPVVLMLPSYANYGLLEALHRKKTLELFTQTEKEEASQDVYRTRLTQEVLNVDSAVMSLRGGENYRDTPRWPTHYVVPSPYRKHVQELGQVNLIKLLEELYRVAYLYSPPEFFTQYPLTNRNFRTTVKTVADNLLHNDSVSLSGTARANSSAHDLITLIRQKWSLLTPDNRAKEPEQSRIVKAWELIEQTFPASGQENLVKQIMIALLNPPYGYDYNTATLLFCMWYGYNTHDLEVRAKGSLISSVDLDRWLQAGPKDFTNSLCAESVTLARRDATKVTKVVRQILAKVKAGGFRKAEAEDAITELKGFADNDRNDAALIVEARKATGDIEAGLQRYQEYETQAKKILTAVNQEKNVRTLFGLLQSLSNISESTLVLSDSPSMSDLRGELMAWLEKVVEDQCAGLENLRDITYLRLNRSQLEELRTELSRAGLSDLVKQVDTSIQALDRKGDELRDRAQEMSIQSAIKAMKPSVLLKDLYGYRVNLRDISGASGETTRLRDQQLGVIEGEIAKLEAFAENAEKELDRAVGIEGFEKFRERLQQLEWRYEDTTIRNAIQKVSARVVELRQFYDEVIQLSKRRVDTQEEVRETKRLLNSLGRKYLTVVGDEQRLLIEKAQSNLDELVRKQELSAIGWLEEQEAQITAGKNLPQLRSRLEHPPSFLPDKEKKRIDALIKQVDHRLDEDVIEQIASYFLRIKDKRIRKKCLTRLEELMEEKAE